MTELVPAVRTATVASFDGDIGLGELLTDDGVRYPFHCIAIADGTRSIDVGARVSFEPLAKLGRWEASAIRPV